MDHAFLMGRRASWGKLDRRPSEIFRVYAMMRGNMGRFLGLDV
jgi:hypothetical protein